MRIWARIVGVAALVVGVTAVVPAVAAHASGSITVGWIYTPGSTYPTVTNTYSCTTGSATYAPGGFQHEVVYVSNNCPNRMWLHQNTNGSGGNYCVNPGAIAYAQGNDGYPITNASSPLGFYQASYSTSNASSPCDSGNTADVDWIDNVDQVNQSPACADGATHTYYDPPSAGQEWVYSLVNHCNVRVWLHANTDGSGSAYCVDPGATTTVFAAGVKYQFQISANQAPCVAGTYSPYPG